MLDGIIINGAKIGDYGISTTSLRVFQFVRGDWPEFINVQFIGHTSTEPFTKFYAMKNFRKLTDEEVCKVLLEQ